MTFAFQEFAIHRKIFSVKNGGYSPTVNYYRALIRGLNVAAESNLTAAQQKTELPTLFIGATNDPIGNVEIENQLITNFSSQPTLKSIYSGHWVQLEYPDKVNGYLKDFFAKIHTKDSHLTGPSTANVTNTANMTSSQ